MSEEQTSYKVTDRRLFNPDGTPRDVPEKRSRKRQRRKLSLLKSRQRCGNAGGCRRIVLRLKPELARLNHGDSEVAIATQQRRLDEPEEVELPGADDPASFASFMMSIASNAASSLGMMEHPVTGKREVDLELGKHWIDVLGMLQQKTRGNLLPQEQQILEGLLADLRMQYVSLTNAAPKARTYSSRDITGG